MDFKMIFKIYF